MDRAAADAIINAGIQAPSGENSQPWRFVLSGDTISLYNLPEKDLSLYNVHQLGSLVSHGAVIENMIIAASTLHYHAGVALMPDSKDSNYTARITFTYDESITPDILNDQIAQRSSNRTQYKNSTLSDGERAALLSSVKAGFEEASLILIEEPTKRKRAAEAMSYGDRLLFENRTIHDFLFSHIFWTKQTAEQAKSGFYVKELGLAGPQEAVFKLLRSDRVLRFFNRIGFPAIAAKGNAQLYASSPVLGAIIIPKNDLKDFIAVGRALERLWLTASYLGYDMQLITAIMFFMQRIIAGEAQDFSPPQVAGIERSYGILKEEFGLTNGHIAIMFRLGKGATLQYRSLRLPPDIRYE